MTSEDELKKRILQQRLQEQYSAQMQDHAVMAQQQQLEATLKVITSQILDTKARERLANLKFVKPELATQLEIYLAQLYQGGQLRTKITDEQLVMILKKLSARPETKIRRK